MKRPNPLLTASLALALVALVPACGGSPDEGAAGLEGAAGDPAAVGIPAPAPDATVHALRCGCAIDSVGTCGEYIEVDGELVELELPASLGSMPFCGKHGLRARVEGELRDGVFVATAFAYED